MLRRSERQPREIRLINRVQRLLGRIAMIVRLRILRIARNLHLEPRRVRSRRLKPLVRIRLQRRSCSSIRRAAPVLTSTDRDRRSLGGSSTLTEKVNDSPGTTVPFGVRARRILIERSLDLDPARQPDRALELLRLGRQIREDILLSRAREPGVLDARHHRRSNLIALDQRRKRHLRDRDRPPCPPRPPIWQPPRVALSAPAASPARRPSRSARAGSEVSIPSKKSCS